MADTEQNQLIGQRIQQQFEFYLLALTFTLLGVAVQTAEFPDNLIADAAELFAWVVLLASGIVGLSRMRDIPHMYWIFSTKVRVEKRIDMYKENKYRSDAESIDFMAYETGEKMSLDEEIKKKEAELEQVQEAEGKFRSKIDSSGQWQ